MTHKTGPETEFEDLKAMLQDYSLTRIPLKGKDIKNDYWNKLKSMTVEGVEVLGPWEAKTIVIDTPREKAKRKRRKHTSRQKLGHTEYGRLYIYKDFAAYQGFLVRRWGHSQTTPGVIHVKF